MKAVLDTSVLIEDPDVPGVTQAAISTISLAELYFGALIATDIEERMRRVTQLGFIESNFDAIPLDQAVARTLGQLQAAVSERGANPRKRTADLVIAATAIAQDSILLTRNYKDFKVIDDLVDVREPPA
ncbi:MAG TPA: PIN domain-containing protein [Solirubrobacterales bacterium]|nr:PIN domain-containing protein [Solirubrobacterales bacterium]